MKVTVQYFAAARERAGTSLEAIDLPPGSSGRDLRALLHRRHPALGDLLPLCRLAVGERFTGDDEPLLEGARLALLPPVSGG